MKQIEQMGAEGYTNGLKAPAQDAKFLATLRILEAAKPRKFGWTISYLNAWNKGWARAHNNATKVN